jgi:hypothetical protein
MAKDSDQLAGTLDADSTGGLLSGLLAEENEFDRRSLWRIGSWGLGAVGAVAVAVMANQSSLGWHREQIAAADLARHAQQIQQLAREGQNETRRLAAAIDTLNNDRDRLYSRVTVLEQGLDSVTGAIAKQVAVAAAPNMPAGTSPALDGQPAPPNQAPPVPAVAPVATTAPGPNEKPREAAKPAPNVATAPTSIIEKPREPAKATPSLAAAVAAPATAATPAPSAAPALVAPKSMMGPPDPAAPKLIEAPRPPAAAMAAVPPDATSQQATSEQAAKEQTTKEPAAGETDTPKAALQRTEFAVDLGSASSIGGLRALWRGILKSNAELAALHPVIVVKESTTGLGMQLRLAAGPLQDAAAAAKICAALLESERACETTVFDGQRLAMAADGLPPGAAPVIKAVPVKRGNYPKHAKKEDAPPAKQDSSALSSWFGSNKH